MVGRPTNCAPRRTGRRRPGRRAGCRSSTTPASGIEVKFRDFTASVALGRPARRSRAPTDSAWHRVESGAHVETTDALRRRQKCAHRPVADARHCARRQYAGARSGLGPIRPDRHRRRRACFRSSIAEHRERAVGGRDDACVRPFGRAVRTSSSCRSTSGCLARRSTRASLSGPRHPTRRSVWPMAELKARLRSRPHRGDEGAGQVAHRDAADADRGDAERGGLGQAAT